MKRERKTGSGNINITSYHFFCLTGVWAICDEWRHMHDKTILNIYIADDYLIRIRFTFLKWNLQGKHRLFCSVYISSYCMLTWSLLLLCCFPLVIIYSLKYNIVWHFNIYFIPPRNTEEITVFNTNKLRMHEDSNNAHITLHTAHVSNNLCQSVLKLETGESFQYWCLISKVFVILIISVKNVLTESTFLIILLHVKFGVKAGRGHRFLGGGVICLQ